jgi:hypothetical protein
MRAIKCSVLLIPLLCVGCPAGKTTTRAPAPSEPTATTASAKAPTGTILSVTDDAGKPVLLVTKGATKYEVSGASGKIGTLKEEVGKFNIEDASGKKVGSVKRDGEDVTLDDDKGAKIAKLKPKEGGYRLKDAADVMLLKIKPKDGEFKLGDEAGNEFGKVKQKGGEIVISDEDGDTLYKVTGSVEPGPAGVLIVQKLSLLQKAAIIVAASQ